MRLQRFSSQETGSSLIEVLVAFMVLAIVMTATVQAAITSLKVTDKAKDGLVMSTIAERELEMLRTLPIDTWALTPGSTNKYASKTKTYVVQGDGHTNYEVTRTSEWRSTKGSSIPPADLCAPPSSTGGSPGNTKDYVYATVSVKPEGKQGAYTYQTSTIIAPRAGGNNPKQGELLIKVLKADNTTPVSDTLTLSLFTKPKKVLRYAPGLDPFTVPLGTKTTSNGCFHIKNIDHDEVAIKIVDNEGKHWWHKQNLPHIYEVSAIDKGTVATKEYVYPTYQTLRIRPFLNTTFANSSLPAGSKLSCKSPTMVPVLDKSKTSPRGRQFDKSKVPSISIPEPFLPGQPPPGPSITSHHAYQWKLACGGKTKDFFIPNYLQIRTKTQNDPNGDLKRTIDADLATDLTEWDIKVSAAKQGDNIDVYFGQCGLAAQYGFKSNEDVTKYVNGTVSTLDKISGTTVKYNEGGTETVYLPLYPAIFNGWYGTNEEYNLYFESVYFKPTFSSSCRKMIPFDIGYIFPEYNHDPVSGNWSPNPDLYPTHLAMPPGWVRTRYDTFFPVVDLYATNQLCVGDDKDPTIPGDFTSTTRVDSVCTRIPEQTGITWDAATNRFKGKVLKR